MLPDQSTETESLLLDVAIIDYGVSNLCSVVRALEYLGFDVLLTNRPEDLQRAPRLILPGQGAFATAMRNLQQSGLDRALETERRAGKPIMGICVGMQIMATSGTENGEWPGLGWIEAVCRRLPITDSSDLEENSRDTDHDNDRTDSACPHVVQVEKLSDLPIPLPSAERNECAGGDRSWHQPGLKLPHVGWNDLRFGTQVDPLFWGIRPQDSSVYFVHSYALDCANPVDVIATCDHGQPFVAAIKRDNLFATQFHPEKSQDNGIRILDNFMNWNP